MNAIQATLSKPELQWILTSLRFRIEEQTSVLSELKAEYAQKRTLEGLFCQDLIELDLANQIALRDKLGTILNSDRKIIKLI